MFARVPASYRCAWFIGIYLSLFIPSTCCTGCSTGIRDNQILLFLHYSHRAKRQLFFQFFLLPYIKYVFVKKFNYSTFRFVFLCYFYNSKITVVSIVPYKYLWRFYRTRIKISPRSLRSERRFAWNLVVLPWYSLARNSKNIGNRHLTTLSPIIINNKYHSLIHVWKHFQNNTTDFELNIKRWIVSFIIKVYHIHIPVHFLTASI